VEGKETTVVDDVRLALIGCGNLGKLHVGNGRRVEGAHMVAFADVREAAAQALAADFPDSYATSDVTRIWRDDGIDAVLICTHHDSHPDLAVAAAEAGKHIFVEKPLALTVAECERIEAAVARAGVQLMVGFKMRFMPLIQEVRRRLPQPLLLVGQMMDGRWGDTHWAQDPHTGGGNVLSQGVHNLDLLWYLANGGEPESIYAAGGTLTHRDTEVIDNVFGTIHFRDGCVAALLNGDAGLPSFTSKFFYEVFDGTRTATLYDRCHRARFDGRDAGELRAEDAFPDEDPEGFPQELAEFVDCVRNNCPPTIGATARDGTRATRLVQAAFTSVRTGQVVRW
jgi:myo-inositol 2-dehydrogenase/D-chiro-inositol 1-dehydrogenase